jgi:hypothetical protein
MARLQSTKGALPMGRFRSLSLALTVIYLASSSGLAQEPAFLLQLNRIESQKESCAVTLMAANRTGLKLTTVSLEVYLLDTRGAAADSFTVKLGSFPEGRSKFFRFTLKQPCESISKLHPNGFTECRGEGDTDHSQLCTDAIKEDNLTSLAFGDAAPK